MNSNSPTPKNTANRGNPLLVTLVGTTAMIAAWLLTPRYGPWACNSLAAPVSIIAALRWRPKPVRVPHSVASLLGSFALGVLLATLSWSVAPIVAHQLPAVGGELRTLYATLSHSPGPARAAPILVLSILAEELVWRGVLIDWCQPRMNRGRTVLLVTASYSLPIVFSGSWLLLLVAIGLGTVLAAQRLYLRTWIGPFITHLTWNILVFVVHPLA
jgi:uncharacterized protein